MRRVITTTNESHPAVPTQHPITGATVTAIYLDGHRQQITSDDEAVRIARQTIATGRYAFVDLRREPDRRAEERKTDPKHQLAVRALYETWEDPIWGLKSSHLDAIAAVHTALALEGDPHDGRYELCADLFFEWDQDGHSIGEQATYLLANLCYL